MKLRKHSKTFRTTKKQQSSETTETKAQDFLRDRQIQELLRGLSLRRRKAGKTKERVADRSLYTSNSFSHSTTLDSSPVAYSVPRRTTFPDESDNSLYSTSSEPVGKAARSKASANRYTSLVRNLTLRLKHNMGAEASKIDEDTFNSPDEGLDVVPNESSFSEDSEHLRAKRSVFHRRRRKHDKYEMPLSPSTVGSQSASEDVQWTASSDYHDEITDEIQVSRPPITVLEESSTGDHDSLVADGSYEVQIPRLATDNQEEFGRTEARPMPTEAAASDLQEFAGTGATPIRRRSLLKGDMPALQTDSPEIPRDMVSSENLMEESPEYLLGWQSDQARNTSHYEDTLEEEGSLSSSRNHVIVLKEDFSQGHEHISLLDLESPRASRPSRPRSRLSVDAWGAVEISHFHAPSSPGNDSTGAQVEVAYLREQPALVKPWAHETQIPVLSPTQQSTPPQSEDEFDAVRAVPAPSVWSPPRDVEDDSSFQSTLEDEHEILTLKRNKAARKSEALGEETDPPNEAKFISDKGMGEIIDLTDMADFGEEPSREGPVATGHGEPTLQTLEALGLINGDTAELLNRSTLLSRQGDDSNQAGDVHEIHQLPSADSALSGSSHESEDSNTSDKSALHSLFDDDETSVNESPVVSEDREEESPVVSSADPVKEQLTGSTTVLAAADLPGGSIEEEDVSLTNPDSESKPLRGESPTEQSLELLRELSAVALHVTSGSASPVASSTYLSDEEESQNHHITTETPQRKSRDPPASSEVPEASDEEWNNEKARSMSPPQETMIQSTESGELDEILEPSVSSTDAPPLIEQESSSESDPSHRSESEEVDPTAASEVEKLEASDTPDDPAPAMPHDMRQNPRALQTLNDPSSDMMDSVATSDVERVEAPYENPVEPDSMQDSGKNEIGDEQVYVEAGPDLETTETPNVPIDENVRSIPDSDHSDLPVSSDVSGPEHSPEDVSDIIAYSAEDSQSPDDRSSPEEAPHGTASIDSYYAEEKNSTGPQKEPVFAPRGSASGATIDTPVLATPPRQTQTKSISKDDATPTRLLAKAMSSLTLEDAAALSCDHAIESTDEASRRSQRPAMPSEYRTPVTGDASAETKHKMDALEKDSWTGEEREDENDGKKVDPIVLANASLSESDSPVDHTTVDSWKRVLNQAKETLIATPVPESVDTIALPSTEVSDDDIAAHENRFVGQGTASTRSIEHIDEQSERSLDDREDHKSAPPSPALSSSLLQDASTQRGHTTTNQASEELDQKSLPSQSLRKEDKQIVLPLQSPSLATEEKDETNASQTDSASACDINSTEEKNVENLVSEDAHASTEEAAKNDSEEASEDDLPALKEVHGAEKVTSLEGRKIEDVVIESSQANVEASEDLSCDFLGSCCGKQADSPPTEVMKTAPGTEQPLQTRYNSIMDKLGHEGETNSTPAVSAKASPVIGLSQLGQSEAISPEGLPLSEQSGIASSPIGHLIVEDASVPTSITRADQPVQAKKKEELSSAQTSPLSVSEGSSMPVIRTHGDAQLPSGDVSLAESSITEISRPPYDFAASQVFSPATSSYRRQSSSPSQAFGYQPRSLKDLLRHDLRSPDKLVVERALQQITIDCFYDHSARSLIARSGGLLSIIAAMEEHPESWQIQVAGCQSLEKLALDEENEQAVSELGGIDCILNAMKNHSNNVRVQESAWSALQNLTCSNSLNETTFDTTDGGMLGLVKSFAKYADHCGVAMHASATLANLCIPNATRTEQVVSADGVVLLAQALQKHWDDEDVRVEISHSLERLCDSIANRSV